jgi:hypothetical protein
MNDEQEAFGTLLSQDFKIGDIVEWATWSSEAGYWVPHYGVLVSLKNEIRSGRPVSISKVVPLNDNSHELEFFTLSLKLVSHSEEEVT